MLLRLLENGEIEFPITIEELQKRFPQTSFAIPITESALPDGYMAVHIETNSPEYSLDSDQEYDLSPPSWDGTKWVQRPIPRQMTEKGLNDIVNEKIKERNRLLAETDWTQLPDVPKGTAEKYVEYRQKLRDITKDPQFPFVTFPEA